MRLLLTSLLVVLTLALQPGCRAADPEQPPLADTEVLLQTTTLPEQQGLGLVAIDLDPETLQVTFAPLTVPERSGQGGLESVHLTSYLTTKPCADCLKIAGVRRLPGGQLGLDVAIRHPFTPGNPDLPGSATNRLDLHVYNVEGVLLVNDFEQKTTFPGLGQVAADTLVSNADGYSANLTPAIVGPLGLGLTVYPYRVFFRDYTQGNFNVSSGYADVRNPRGYMVMPMGSGYDTKTFQLRLPGTGQRRLYLYAQASWGQANLAPGSLLEPVYRVPQFSKKAASEVTVSVVTNGLKGGDAASTASLRIRVLDTNADAPVGTGLGEIDFHSYVARIDVEVPGLMTAPLVLNNPTPVQGQPRNILNPLAYDVTIPNAKGAGVGNYLGLVRVLDAYPAGQTGDGLGNNDVLDAPGPGSNPLQFARQLTEYATYAVFALPITDAGCPNNVTFTAAEPPDPVLGVPYTYTFQATGGTAPYTFSVANGTLPEGLSLADNGLLSGTPTRRADFFQAWPVTIRVQDACSTPASAQTPLTLRVNLRPVTFVYFDIGQGHATLIYSAAKEALLLDVGPSNKPRGERIRDFIINNGLTLKYTIASHFDGDHIGNIAYIISGPDGAPGRKNVDDDGDGSTDNFEDREEYGWPGSDDLMPLKSFDTGNDDLENQQSDRIWRAATWRARQTWTKDFLGDKSLMSLSEPGLELWIAAGNRAVFNGVDLGRSVTDENTNSLSVIFSHGAFDTEIGGDLVGSSGGGGQDFETTLANALASIGFGLDVMMAHHHGSRYSSNTTWMNLLKPEVILIQCGAGNPYGHPHQELLNRIDTVLYTNPVILEHMFWSTTGTADTRTFDGINVTVSPVITQASGDITIVTDGRNYTVTTPQGQRHYPVDLALP